MCRRIASDTKPHDDAMADSAPRILVGSADHLIARMFESILADLGYQVSCAHSGTDVLDAVRDKQPDLVLLDLGAPDRGAMALCAGIRELAGDNPLPLLTLADAGGARIVHQVFLAGATDFFVKPMDPTLLTAKIRQALQHRANTLSLLGQPAEVHVDLPTAALGTWRYDPLTKMLSLSDTLDATLDLGTVETGQSLSQLLSRVHRDDRRGVRGALRRALHLGRGYELEHRMADQHGRYHRVHHQVHPQRHAEFGHFCLNGSLKLLSKPAGNAAEPCSEFTASGLVVPSTELQAPSSVARY